MCVCKECATLEYVAVREGNKKCTSVNDFTRAGPSKLFQETSVNLKSCHAVSGNPST